MSTDTVEKTESPPLHGSHPLEGLHRVDRRQARRDSRLHREGAATLLREALAPLTGPIGLGFELGLPERIDRAAGLGRPGVVAQFSWPRLETRLALGIEPPLAHAIVDRLLGFWRFPGQDRLQITPVEWGLLSYVAARGLSRLAEMTGPLGPWDLILDRVSPEPFPTRGLGAMITVRWPVTLGDATGSARLWMPEELFDRMELVEPVPPEVDPEIVQTHIGELASDWTAEIGTIYLVKGLRSLRPGAVLPISGCKLSGKPSSPAGRLDLTARTPGMLYRMDASAVPNTAGGRVSVQPPLTLIPSIREPVAMSGPAEPTSSAPVTSRPTDLPVTLIVELGRVSLPLAKLADLRAGDILDLGRRPQEPVELTSGGRLVARGELVQIDTELGIRLTNVFL